MSYIRIQCRSDEALPPEDDTADRQAESRFRVYHRFPSRATIRHPCRRTIPRVLVKLGELKGIIYRSDRLTAGRPRTYIHFLDTPPLLTCDPEGDQLYIIGGRYRVTSRGIEG